ncbi:putative type II secretion system protein [Magnetofaba australis IT-1]|uniref:Putative type II secretion system protein n=2 Tax=Magnetofaba TaxID=1472292 RepID=A0A1Y2K9C4_9PROT|nr:putative type II secretion system protein [Magnetofaba australis IT-1]
MATLLNAGFPLAKALKFIKKQEKIPQLSDALGQVDEDVRAGATLSEALTRHPGYFNALYVNMVRAGETGGILDQMVERLADMREADEELAAKIKGAMTYPALMMLAMLGSILILFVFVIPKFAVMFEDMGQALPTPTLIMLGIGDVLQQGWWLIVGTLVGLYVGVHTYGQTPNGRLTLDRIQLKTPLIGDFVSKVAMARLCRIMGTLLDSGVPLLTTFEAGKGVAGNAVISDAITGSLNAIREGGRIGPTFAATGAFPELVTEMITLGEESGRVGTMMLKVAAIYERQTDETVKTLTSILEPVMILVMGGVVGMVVVAMLMPIFEMNLIGG